MRSASRDSPDAVASHAGVTFSIPECELPKSNGDENRAIWRRQPRQNTGKPIHSPQHIRDILSLTRFGQHALETWP